VHFHVVVDAHAAGRAVVALLLPPGDAGLAEKVIALTAFFRNVDDAVTYRANEVILEGLLNRSQQIQLLVLMFLHLFSEDCGKHD